MGLDSMCKKNLDQIIFNSFLISDLGSFTLKLFLSAVFIGVRRIEVNTRWREERMQKTKKERKIKEEKLQQHRICRAMWETR